MPKKPNWSFSISAILLLTVLVAMAASKDTDHKTTLTKDHFEIKRFPAKLVQNTLLRTLHNFWVMCISRG